MNGHFRSQADILDAAQKASRDAGAARWSAVEIYQCLNQALQTWDGRVGVPKVYTIPSGWTSTTDTYALPAYVHGHVQPQVRYAPVTGEVTDATWVNLRMFHLEPDGDGGMNLRVRVSGSGIDLTTDGRVIWYGKNSPVPTTPPTLSGTIAADATSLVVNAAVDVADTGYLKVDAEWMGYTGVTRAASTTTLLNLERALNGSAAASHTAGATVYWAVCAPNLRLFAVLHDQVRMHMHEMFLDNASPKEQELHERMMLYYENRVREAWRTHVPARSPSMVQANTAR